MVKFRNYRKRPVRKPRMTKATAGKKIVRAMKAYNNKKKLYRRYKSLSGGQYQCVKVRMHRSLQKNHFKPDPAGGMYFNIYFAPWRNLQTTPATSGANLGFANIFYHNDFKQVFDNQQYNYFRLKGVYMEFRRPKCFINMNTIDDIEDATNPWCTQVLHTFEKQLANTTTGLEPSYDVSTREEIRHPASWNEAVDDGKRTRLHHYNKYAKRVWLPFNNAERKWRATSDAELDHSVGGIHIRLKNSSPLPNAVATYADNQVLYDITATVYMEFRGKQ